jgi:hypothetical protein
VAAGEPSLLAHIGGVPDPIGFDLPQSCLLRRGTKMRRPYLRAWEENMIKLVAVAFLVSLVSPVQAMPRAAIEQPGSLIGAKHLEQVCIVLMVSACVHPLGVKQPGALQDYATSAAAAFDKHP